MVRGAHGRCVAGVVLGSATRASDMGADRQLPRSAGGRDVLGTSGPPLVGELRGGSPRGVGCDASAAVSGSSVIFADPVRSGVSGLARDGVVVPVSIPCVRGLHAAGLSRISGGAGLPSRSAEETAAVKGSPSGPRRGRAGKRRRLTAAGAGAAPSDRPHPAVELERVRHPSPPLSTTEGREPNA